MSKGEGYQDGKVRGYRTRLPPQTHQKYIHMGSNSPWKQNGDWQKDSYTTKATGKIHMYQGREEKWSGQDLCPWEGTQKRRGITWAQRSSLGSEQFEPHIGYPSPGVTPGGWVPLASLKTSGTENRALRNIDSAHEEHTHACLLLKQSRESQLKLPGILAGFLQTPKRAPQPQPSTHSGPASSTVQFHTRLRAVTAKESEQL